MKLLRVNMKNLQTEWEPVTAPYEHLGGRALIAKLLLEEGPDLGRGGGDHGLQHAHHALGVS